MSMIFSIGTIILDATASIEHPKPVRPLPYVLVPGMDINSRVFHKALSTIAKQNATVPATSMLSSPPAGNRNLVDSLLRLDHGESLFCSYWLTFSKLLVNNLHFTEIPTDLIGNLERDVLYRARDVITNATMADIMGEDPNSPQALRDAIRQQILALCTRLRVSLVIIDKLMAFANSLMPKQSK